MTASRFPPPWSVEEQSACYVVRDHGGHQLAYYFEDEPGREQHPTLTLAEAMDALMVARWNVTTVARRCCAWRS